MGFPYLSVTIFIPLAAAIVVMLLPERRRELPRVVALAAAAVTLLLSVLLYFSYDAGLGGYQFVEQYAWVPQFGISYHVGVDGFSAPLVLLSGVVLFTGVLVSWNVSERTREFFSLFLILATSVIGVFVSLDLFLLFFFFELAVFPKYLMIVLWGYPGTRNYGGMKLTLYLFAGSMLALVGSLALYAGSGLQTFDMLALESAGYPLEFQRLWFPVIFMGFAVLGGIFPFHSWAPDGHVAAPTAVSMLLAGVEMKVGAFAALRVAIVLLPDGAQIWTPLILALALINVVYGAFLALTQTDFKYVIGFSSVSHMGLVLIGFATLTPLGLLGSGLQMFSHGIMTALFFAIVGMVYDRTHTREIASLGGLFGKLPWAGVGFIVAGLVSMGMPAFSGFVAEMPIFMGMWQVSPVVALIAVLSILITAAYILLVMRRVFFGGLPERMAAVTDIGIQDKLAIGLLVGLVVVLGWFPGVMVPIIQSGVDHFFAMMGGI